MAEAGFDFGGLTNAQQAVLMQQGWAPGRGKQPRPNTMTKLLDRGLVVARSVRVAGVEIAAYDVPTPVHIAWCEHCSRSIGAPRDGMPQ